MIVADTNLIAALVLRDDRLTDAERVLALDDTWIAPGMWRAELANTLWKLERAGRITSQQSLPLLRQAGSLVRTAGDTSEANDPTEHALALAVRTGCTVYDCLFSSLALKHDIPLVTWDKQLLAAFPDLAISPEQFVA